MSGTSGQRERDSAERTARSIFVGNIPYEATEDRLRDMFEQAGPVTSFRLVYDRESGKPKGYGFCEYKDIPTAQAALRNLQSIEFNGRPLRIGPAAGEQNNQQEPQPPTATGPPVDSPYGDKVDPKNAPEEISKAVASLPPEQMYELMRQMKQCIQNSPHEARNMLLQNPQLAYALLQAQIVMKLVDPKLAIAMLNRSSEQVPPPLADAQPQAAFQQQLLMQQQQAPMQQFAGAAAAAVPAAAPAAAMPPPPTDWQQQQQPQQFAATRQPMPPLPPQQQQQQPPPPPPQQQQQQQQQPAPPLPQQQQPKQPDVPLDAIAGGDREKAALIMQVLQLTDEQIQMLPEDQRKSIMVLKDQLAKAGHI